MSHSLDFCPLPSAVLAFWSCGIFLAWMLYYGVPQKDSSVKQMKSKMVWWGFSQFPCPYSRLWQGNIYSALGYLLASPSGTSGDLSQLCSSARMSAPIPEPPASHFAVEPWYVRGNLSFLVLVSHPHGLGKTSGKVLGEGWVAALWLVVCFSSLPGALLFFPLWFCWSKSSGKYLLSSEAILNV
jgi:hypothetical protein